jgi:hypothetical protein
MNTLTNEKRCAVIRCLVDGCSIRATTRMTGVAKNTIQKLTRELGEAVQQYSDNVLRNIKSQRVQCDEVRYGVSATPKTRTCPTKCVASGTRNARAAAGHERPHSLAGRQFQSR